MVRTSGFSVLWRAARGAALLAVVAFGGVGAYAQDVDAALGAVPSLTPVAPVPVYTPDVDQTNGLASQGELGPTDAIARQVECDITTGGSTTSDYVGLILDRDATDNLFIKVQQQDSSGEFSHVGFYHDSGTAGGWAGMTGGTAFFTLAAGDKFTSAHMIVIHDGAGNVTLRLTNIDGGGKVLEFTRGGWTPRNATGAGFGGWTGTYPIDNWGRGEPTDYICDDFNRANGGLGAGWSTVAGTASIVSNAARGDGNSKSIFIGRCAGGIGQEVEADVSLVSTALDYCA
ncbi:MAG: hypothetical protein AB1716_25570, partial [Planctomycetota bacterium]